MFIEIKRWKNDPLALPLGMVEISADIDPDSLLFCEYVKSDNQTNIEFDNNQMQTNELNEGYTPVYGPLVLDKPAESKDIVTFDYGKYMDRKITINNKCKIKISRWFKLFGFKLFRFSKTLRPNRDYVINGSSVDFKELYPLNYGDTVSILYLLESDKTK